MSLEPFRVGHPGPDYVIIVFLGYDNDLPVHLIDHHLNEMARGAGPDTAIIAIADDPLGPDRVVEVTSRTITLLEDLGEIDTGRVRPAGDLLARALVSYPGQPRIAIGFSGHGSGVFDEELPDQLLRALDLLANPRAHLLRSLQSDESLRSAFSVNFGRPNTQLSNGEIGRMLRAAFDAADRAEPVDLLFFDTCLNGMIEIATEFADFAACIVGSQDNEPVTGWHYDKWLSLMTSSPPADPAAWGRQAVDAMTAAYAVGMTDPVTLSAIAAGPVPSLVVARFEALLDAAVPLGRAGYDALNGARLGSHALGGGTFDSYDLCEFADRLARREDMPTLAQAATALAEAVGDAVLHLTNLRAPNAHGLAFWFPGNRRSYDKDVGTYSRLRFDRETGWSAFLGRHLPAGS